MSAFSSHPLWRSMLFVPANVPRFIDKAHRRGADAIILDLEDSVIPQEKAAARQAVREAAKIVGQAGADVTVRINRAWRLAVRDVEAVVCREVCALILPKTEGPEHIRAIAEVVEEVEAELGLEVGHTKLIALVETPDAYFSLREIAKAHPRLIAMTLGAEDFSLEMNMPPTPDGLSHAVRECAIAARAGGLMPMGFVGTLSDFADRDAFRQMAEQGRALGFEGAFCIHPDQVAILNDAFGPSAGEVDTAKRVIGAFDAAKRDGLGAVKLDGKMIDIPVVERARKTLIQYEKIAYRQAMLAANETTA